MKKLLITVIGILLIPTAFADNGFAQLGMKISGQNKNNSQFVCIYDVGCLSVQAANKGDVFPVADGDMANLNKIVIADMSKKTMSFQNIPASCGVQLADNQKMTIEGHLVVTSRGSEIENLHCQVSTVKTASSSDQT